MAFFFLPSFLSFFIIIVGHRQSSGMSGSRKGHPNPNLDPAASVNELLSNHSYLKISTSHPRAASGTGESHIPYFQWKFQTHGLRAKEFEEYSLQKTQKTVPRRRSSSAFKSTEGEASANPKPPTPSEGPKKGDAVPKKNQAGVSDPVPITENNKPWLLRHKYNNVRTAVNWMINQPGYKEKHGFMVVNTPKGQEYNKERDFQGKENVFIIDIKNKQARVLAPILKAISEQNIKFVHYFPPHNTKLFGIAELTNAHMICCPMSEEQLCDAKSPSSSRSSRGILSHQISLLF